MLVSPASIGNKFLAVRAANASPTLRAMRIPAPLTCTYVKWRLTGWLVYLYTMGVSGSRHACQ